MTKLYTFVSFSWSVRSLKRVVFSRAYVNFHTSEDVYDFKQRFDGHVFIGQKGHQYRCSVEYAPLQRVPVQEEKPHPLEGTIERGEYRLSQTGPPSWGARLPTSWAGPARQTKWSTGGNKGTAPAELVTGRLQRVYCRRGALRGV